LQNTKDKKIKSVKDKKNKVSKRQKNKASKRKLAKNILRDKKRCWLWGTTRAIQLKLIKGILIFPIYIICVWSQNLLPQCEPACLIACAIAHPLNPSSHFPNLAGPAYENFGPEQHGNGSLPNHPAAIRGSTLFCASQTAWQG